MRNPNQYFLVSISTVSLLAYSSLSAAESLPEKSSVSDLLDRASPLQIEDEPDEDEPEEPDEDEPEEPDEDEPEEPDEDEPDEPDEDEPEEPEEPDEDEPDEPEEGEGDEEPDEGEDDEEPSDEDDQKPVDDKKPDAEQKPAAASEEASSEQEEAQAGRSSESDAASKKKPTTAPAGKRATPPAPQREKKIIVPPLETLDERQTASAQATEEAAEAALIDAPRRGPSLTPITLSTSTWSRLEIRENYDALGVEWNRRQEGDQVVFRTRLGIETNPLPISDSSDVLLKFTPQAFGYWGMSGNTFTEANLGIYEGYVKIRSRRLDVSFGRTELVYGEGVVIGNRPWNERGRSFDGIVAHYKMNEGYVDFLGLQVEEGHPDVNQVFLAGDTYFWGAYGGFGKYIDDDFDFDVYFLGLSGVRSEAASDPLSAEPIEKQGGTLFTAGTRIKHQVSFFDYRIEGGLQFGETAGGFRGPEELESPQTLAYQVDGELGFSIGALTRIALGGVYASGDDPGTRKIEGWNPLFPRVHRFLGLTDVIGLRTNVASGNLKIKRGITEDFWLQVDGHVFARPQFGGLGQVGTNKMAGVEVDTQLFHKIGQYVLVRGLYGLFIPSTGHYVSDALVSYGELQAGLEF